MKRRGNKSAKVPNVKLRPAQEGALTRLRRQESSVCWAEDSQLGSDDTGIMDLCPRPFKGVVLCATGVVDKPTLFKQAVELGATSTSAFTDRVTHLVAVEHGGAKYNCALERKIPILQPSWIAENYQVWLRGDDVELEESMDAHRLPIFSNVILCLSGINEITRRTQINKLVTQHGGVYVKNLERPVKVTHLLCSGDEETEKMRYAEKFNARGEANVHLVWEEWFWDSLEFGGRFDEETYQVRRPRPERKSLLETASSPPASSVAQSDPQDQYMPPQDRTRTPPPHDEPDEELATVQRLPAATLQLWGSLLHRRGYEVSGGELIRSPSKAPPQHAPTIPRSSSPDATGGGSVIAQFRRTNSFAPVRSDTPNSALPQPFRRTRTVAAINPNNDTTESFMASARQGDKNGESSKAAAAGSGGIFAGLRFTALGEAKSASVRAAIEENGGKMVIGGDDERVDFIIVRLVSGSKIFRDEADESLRSKYRTECWLERCVFQESICPPEDHIAFTPLVIQPPVVGAEKIALSFSGLDQAEAMWVTRLLRALGITLEQFFSRRSTHLLCPSATGPKFDKACQWGIPVVTMEWLAAIANTARVPPASAFLVPGYRRAGTEELVDVHVDVKGKGKAVDKGKGKILVEDSVTETASSGVGDHPTQSPRERPLKGVRSRRPSASPQRTPLEILEVPFESATGPLAISTQKHPSTPKRDKASSEIFAFGKPTGLLGGVSDIHRLARTPTRARSTPTIQNTPQHRTQPKAPSAHVASTSKQQLNNERERRNMRIPSSKSPSPLKIPGHQQARARVPTESPTRIPPGLVKTLEDNITTLLGKRPAPPDESAASNNNSRPGKRARPQRPTRMQSRQASEAQLAVVEEAPMDAIPAYDDSMDPFGVQPLDELEPGGAEESIRVTYEDPKQREETKRLMSLLNVNINGAAAGPSDSGAEGRKGSLKPRKSARIAGF
ncbi:hypothetical protein H0H81_007103 [Sphagnurus paluster]|uniref:BRCT domain-containing protein n=1 Tax=Sphagnurus paluster TaxID=117069 RepID=A0A9P7FQK6_9AGAR|nr:hypothetical protein H0H81_007103 [Sphagnurus paluster]